jgi:uncharacterized coiled-coil protein SlyX
MVAKIQQVGVVEGAGDLKKDGSVPMDVGYFPTAEQDISTKGYVDSQNSGFVKSDRSIGLIDMGTPFSDEPTAMKDLLSDNIKISQTVKNAKTDIILTEKLTSVDISIGDIDTRVSSIETSTTDLTPRIDSLESDNTSNKQDIQTLTDITNLHTQALNVQTDKITELEDTSLSKVTGLMDDSYTINTINDAKHVIIKEYLDSKLIDIDTDITNLQDNIGSVNITALQTQTTTNTNDITNIKAVNTSQDSTIASLQSQVASLLTKLNSYDTKYRSFTSKLVKNGLNVDINSNSNILTNLTKYFIASQNPTITSFGSSISGLPLGAINLIEVGTGANQGFKFPIIDGIVNANLTFTVRVTGSISGNAGTPRELIVYLRRVSDNSIVANGGIIKVNDNNFNARSVIVPSFIQGVNDPFYVGGFYLDLLNQSGGNLTLTSIEMLIQG